MKKIYILLLIMLSTSLYSNVEDGEAYFYLGLEEAMEKNYDEAMEDYKKSCDNNYEQGCSFLADLHIRIKKDRDIALPLYMKSCNLKIEKKEKGLSAKLTKPCREVALYYLDNGLKKNENLIIEYMTKSCDLKNADSCANLGKFSFTHKKEKETILFMTKACKLGSNIGCDSVGQFYLEGYGGTKKDFKKGISFLKKACDANYEEACIHKTAYMLTNKLSEKDKTDLSEYLKNLNIPKE